MKNKIRIAISGLGNRSVPRKVEESNWIGWAEQIRRSDQFELAGGHDIATESLDRAVEREYLSENNVYTDLHELLTDVECDALLVTNPAEAHSSAIRIALEHDVHVLIEKPFICQYAEGEQLINEARSKSLTMAVVQNWRCKEVGRVLYDSIQKGLIGRVGHVFYRYMRDRENPKYPEYIFEEPFPLLYAMGIHHLDLVRYFLQDEICTVRGAAFRPPWSLYKSSTGVNLTLKTDKDISILYTGTFSTRTNKLKQESLIVEGERGSLVCESQWLEPPLWFYPYKSGTPVCLVGTGEGRGGIKYQYDLSDREILENFSKAIQSDQDLICSAQDALRSIQLIDACRRACETGKEVRLVPHVANCASVG